LAAKFAKKPTPQCYSDALIHKITSYYKVLTFNDMQTALANGYPFVFGFSVYQSFETIQVAKTGILNLPKKKEQLLGGHAVMCVGYDNLTGRFKVRNSWGPQWGQGGYFTMPYGYLTNPNLASDMWVITK
jgi:C1A family cysteine protease